MRMKIWGVRLTFVLIFKYFRNITSIGFHEDGKFMFTGSEDCRVRIWDNNSAQHTCKRVFDCLSPVLAVCLHPNQVELAIATSNASIFLWNISNDYNEQLLPESNNSVKLSSELINTCRISRTISWTLKISVNSIEISPDGRFMAAINNKGLCYIWDLTSSDRKDELTKMNAKIKFVSQTKYGLKCKFSPDSKLLVTTGGDGTARIYRTDDDFKLYRELRIEKFWMWDVAFSSDSKYLFIASSDGLARLWKIETKTIEREYTGHTKALTALCSWETNWNCLDGGWDKSRKFDPLLYPFHLSFFIFTKNKSTTLKLSHKNA